MTMKELASEIAFAEGLKAQVSIGNVREILGLLSDKLYKDSSAFALLYANGKNRAKKKKR